MLIRHASTRQHGAAFQNSVQSRMTVPGLTGSIPRIWARQYVCGELHEFADKKTGVGQYYLQLKNQTDRPVRLSRADIGVVVEDSPARLHYYTSFWGDEFTPMAAELSDPFFIEVISGRSNKGYAPWLGLECESGFISMNIGWSGNWQAAAKRQELDGPGTVRQNGNQQQRLLP